MSLHADFDEMTEVAAHLRTQQEEIISIFDDINTKVEDLTGGAFVTPEASQAYADKAAEFVESNKPNIEQIESFATWLDETANTLQGTDSDLAGSVG